MPGVTATRLLVQDVCADTPAEVWCSNHVLYKILFGKSYERQLQIVSQLAVLYKRGGKVVQLGVTELGVHPESVNDGGLVEMSAEQKGSPRVAAMMTLFVDTLRPADLSSAPGPVDIYDRATWPWTDKTDAAVLNLTEAIAESASKPVAKAAHVAVHPRVGATRALMTAAQNESFALLSFYKQQEQTIVTPGSEGLPPMNLGDEMQQLAAAQYMPYVSHFVERQDLNLSWSDGGRVIKGPPALGTGESRTRFIANAWYNSDMRVWPPPDHLNPVLLALHFEGDVPDAYSESAAAYYKARWPLGSRDPATAAFLGEKVGISSVWNGDLTWTLSPLCKRSDSDGRLASASAAHNKYVIVDVDEARLLHE